MVFPADSNDRVIPGLDWFSTHDVSIEVEEGRRLELNGNVRVNDAVPVNSLDVTDQIESEVPPIVRDILPFFPISDGLTSTFQEAVNSAEAFGGGTVVVEGVWLLTSAISIGSNVHIVLSDGTVIRRGFGVSIPQAQAAKYLGSLFRQKSTSAGAPTKNISITGPGTIESNGFDGPVFAFYFVEGLHLADFFVDYTGAGDWCVTVSGKYISIDNLTIRGGAVIFEDGIHILYGEHYRVSNCHIESGDDSIALTTFDANPIRYITVNNITSQSVEGHAFRIGLDSVSSAVIEHVTYSNAVSLSGINRNALVTLLNSSTDRQKLRNIVLTNITTKGTTGGTINRRGLYIDCAYNVSVSNFIVDGALWESLYINNSDEIKVNNSSFSCLATATNPVCRILSSGFVYLDNCLIDSTNTTGVPIRLHTVLFTRVSNCNIKNVPLNTQAIFPELNNGTLIVIGNKVNAVSTASHGIRCGATGLTKLIYANNHMELGTGQIIYNDANLPSQLEVSPSGFTSIAYAASIQPSLWATQVGKVTLTGNISITNPFVNPVGAKQKFIFAEDATGGRTITFGTAYKTNWTPDTAANKINVIEFVCDGTNWIQEAAVVGLT